MLFSWTKSFSLVISQQSALSVLVCFRDLTVFQKSYLGVGKVSWTVVCFIGKFLSCQVEHDYIMIVMLNIHTLAFCVCVVCMSVFL